MSIIEKAVYRLANGKRTITNTVFIKEFEKENQQLKDLIELSSKVFSRKKGFIDRDINYLKQGIDGEQNVYFELKNSFIPMLCFHDIRLEYGEYIAQFDFIVITNKFIYVIETKKLNGDIEITSDGDFIRIIRNSAGKFIKKEGMDSPVSQNQRHVNILREILINEKIIKTLPIKSAVVMANPKTIVNKNKAPKEIQEKIYKYDQITTLLKRELNDEKNEKNMLEKYMYQIADFIVRNNKPITIDYVAKYSLTEDDFIRKQDLNTTQKEEIIVSEKSSENKEIIENNIDDNSSELYELLKKYRLNTSKAEGVKPYFIFNNTELDLLVHEKPKTREELLQIKGFGQKKIDKYGDAILSLINEL